MSEHKQFTLVCDEPHYVESAYNEEMEQIEREIVGRDGLEMMEQYYWIEEKGRDDVLAVKDFMEGEKIMTDLTEGEINSLEEAEQSYRTAVIQPDRPPY